MACRAAAPGYGRIPYRHALRNWAGAWKWPKMGRHCICYAGTCPEEQVGSSIQRDQSNVVVVEAPRNRKTPGAKATGGSGFRADIQALRALAVLLVVGNHLWPVRLTGGYVGVDVFFGHQPVFLITSHLSKELFATGRVSLRQFYARRARRLLPAALTLLGVSLVAAWLWLPYTRWSANAQEIVSSAFYVENWGLAAKAVNYSSHEQ